MAAWWRAEVQSRRRLIRSTYRQQRRGNLRSRHGTVLKTNRHRALGTLLGTLAGTLESTLEGTLVGTLRVTLAGTLRSSLRVTSHNQLSLRFLLTYVSLAYVVLVTPKGHITMLLVYKANQSFAVPSACRTEAEGHTSSAIIIKANRARILANANAPQFRREFRRDSRREVRREFRSCMTDELE